MNPKDIKLLSRCSHLLRRSFIKVSCVSFSSFVSFCFKTIFMNLIKNVEEHGETKGQKLTKKNYGIVAIVCRPLRR